MEMPDFLQLKHNTQVYNIKETLFGNRKKFFGFLVLAVLLIGIPLTVWLAQRIQIFRPRAGSEPIELVTGDSCVVSAETNQVSCATFPIRLTSPLGPPAGSEVISCTSDEQCGSGEQCFNYQEYPGSCKSTGTLCAQVITRACDPSNQSLCVDFPTPCHVPPGWSVPSPAPKSSPTISTPVSGGPNIDASKTGTYNTPRIHIEWQAVSGASLYKVFRTTDAPGSGIKVGETSGIAINDENVVSGTKYNYVVEAVRESGPINGSTVSVTAVLSDVCSQTNPTVSSPIVGGPNIDISKTGSYNIPRVHIEWAAVSGASVYKVFRTTDAPGSGIKVGETSGIAINDQGISGGTQYNYFVEAVRSEGSTNGNTITLTTVTAPTCQAKVRDFSPLRTIAQKAAGWFSLSEARAQISACSNIAANGSFENPVISQPATNDGWEIYGAASLPLSGIDTPGVGTTEPIPDWEGRVNGASYQIELHKGLFGAASNGVQYAEVDQPGLVSLTQIIPTELGQQYTIKFDYSSRPDFTTTQKMGVYWNGQQVGTVDGTSHGQGVSWSPKSFDVSGVAGNSTLGFGALNDSTVGKGNFIDNVSVTLTSGVCASPSPSASSSASPSVSPSPLPSVATSPSASLSSSATPSPTQELSGTVSYKIAESEEGLATATTIPYNAHPTLSSFTFSNSTPGAKQIWVEFRGIDGETRKEHISVELVDPDPFISSLDCSMDVSRQNLRVVVNGQRLGTSGGKITANNKDAQLTSWGENQITATIKPDASLEQGQQFKVKVTKSDEKVLPEVICEVNTSLISLGARLFCRTPGTFDVNGVKVSLIDENGGKVDEEVTVDSEGLIKGLKTRLQVGKGYALTIKAPNSLRKNVEFIAANGTSVVKPADDDSLILPTGDIAPVVLTDGKINVPDRAELVRQWSVLGSGARTGDFNRDLRVNSIDWACMRFDFNKEDEKIPLRAQGIPSGSSPVPVSSSSPSSSTGASPTPAASPSLTPSPLPSGQRAGFFLLEPLEGGTYVNGDEFIVDVNIWSQVEAANLFVAKLAFDPTTLEVVRIEKGAILTTWAEEFFNNQTGHISLVAGKPSPGLKTNPGDNPRMARVVFKGKKVGTTSITVTGDSKIYSNLDNSNILTSLLSTQIAITN